MKQLACVGFITLLSSTVLAQSSGPPTQAKLAAVEGQTAPAAPVAATPTAAAPAAFEVAAIRPAPPSTKRGPRIRIPPSGLAEFEGTLQHLVGFAFDISDNVTSDLLKGPSFLESERFNITAKVPRREGEAAPISLSVVRPMLRALFEERFKLATHREEREVTAYALVVPQQGPKLKRADGSQPASCRATPGAVPAVGHANPPLAFTCQNTTMADLSHNLQRWANVYFDHPVVDATGLEGGWDFVLAWTPLSELRGMSAAGNQPDSTAAAADPGVLTVFEAVETQLGLKLTKGKHKVSVVVIDHMEQMPIASGSEAGR